MTRSIPKGQVLRHSMESMYERLTQLVEHIPEECDLRENEEAAHIAQDIWAIEEEWIVDPILRAELSVLQPIDDDDDE